MRKATLPLPEIGLFAATRGMIGAGAALLIAGKMDSEKRKKVGWPLLAIGALSTIPFLMHMMRVSQCEGRTSITEP